MNETTIPAGESARDHLGSAVDLPALNNHKEAGDKKRGDWLKGQQRLFHSGRLAINGIVAYPQRNNITEVQPTGYVKINQIFVPLVPVCKHREGKATSCCVRKKCSLIDDFVTPIDCHACTEHDPGSETPEVGRRLSDDAPEE